MADRSTRLLDAHGGQIPGRLLGLAIRTAQHTQFPGVTLQRIEMIDGLHPATTSVERFTPECATEAGVMLIAAGAIAAGRLDQVDLQQLLDAAQRAVADQIMAARATGYVTTCRQVG